MAEEIKIVVREERQGTAIKDAQADAQKLKEANRGIGAPTPVGAPQPVGAPTPVGNKPLVGWPANPGLAADPAKPIVGWPAKPGMAPDPDAAPARPKSMLATEAFAGVDKAEKAKKLADEQLRVKAAQASLEEKTAAAQEALNAELVAAAEKEMEIAAAKELETATMKAQEALNAELVAAEEKRLAIETQITKEKALQAAEAKLGMRQGFQQFAANSGTGVGGLAGMAGLSGAMLPIVAAMAVLGEVVKTAIARDADRAEDRQAFAQQTARRGVIGGHNATRAEGEAGSNAAGIQDELEEAQSKKGTFQNTSPISDWLMKGLQAFGAKVETSGQKAERENDLKIDRLKKESPEAQAQARDKFSQGSGGLSIEAEKQRLQGHFNEARAIQYKIDRQREYARVLAAVGGASKDGSNERIAADAAEVKVMREKQTEAMKFGALVNARSGAADVARAAQLSQQFMHGETGIGKLHQSIDNLHSTVREQHRQIMGAATEQEY